MTTRLLRTIFIAHKLHLRNPKCIFPPLLSRHSSTATNSSEAREPAKETTTTTTTTSWSMYGNVYDRPIAQRELNDHSDGDENPSSGRAAKSVAVVTKIKGKGKVKTQWVCCSCGHSTGKWWGQCPECEMVGTMNEFHESKLTDSKSRGGLEVSEDAVGLWLPQRPEDLRPVKLEEVNRGFNYQQWRIPLSGSFGNEVSTVLGGGLVPGSLTLVGGDPGIGKSTLLLQIAAMIANECSDYEGPPVVYVSGEESLQQIGIRADRLGIKSNIYLYSSTDIEDILTKTHGLSPRALVVDSIQTVYLKTIIGSAGGIMQVKECTAALMRFAKTTNISVFLIGHVTKSGDIAGPRVLEHIVDVVLYMEGEKYSPYRMLRAVKNRFGSTDELAVLEMSQSGLQVVSNASEMFLTQQHSDSNVLAGLAIAVIMDGSRTFLIEIQVLIKQTGLHLQDNAVFLNVVSGMTVTETAGDLAIAAAICSSFLEFPIPEGTAFIGEIGLGGELRMVPRIEKRVNTLVKLGYRMCVVPKQAEKLLETEGLGKMKVVGCKDLKEVINAVFSRNN
ncbi:DNA repair protein RadA like [Glycine soja]|nr:DNA repair protein RadA like [Glycine soja]